MDDDPIRYNDPNGDCAPCVPLIWGLVEAAAEIFTAETAVAATGAAAGTAAATHPGILKEAADANTQQILSTGYATIPLGFTSISVNVLDPQTIVTPTTNPATVKGTMTLYTPQDVVKAKATDKPGSYTNTHESGKKYHGKGPEKRADASAKRITKKHDDPLKKKEWKASKNNREAFKNEAKRLKKDGGPESDNNYNQRESPGKKYSEEDKGRQ